MAWEEQWTHRIDGFDLNDLAAGLVCDVPEVSNPPEYEHVLAEVANGFPVYHRSQPQSSRRTFFIHVLTDDEGPPGFDARYAAVLAALGPGLHTYTYQVRGMAAPASVQLAFDSTMVDEFKVGRVTATATVPDPRPVPA